MNLRHGCGLVKQPRFGVKLGFIPGGIRQIFDSGGHQDRSYALTDGQVEQGIAIGHYRIGLIGRSFSNMTVSLTPFETGRMPQRQAAG